MTDDRRPTTRARPRLYLMNFGSVPHADPKPLRVLTIMARPRIFELGEGRVSVLAPLQHDLSDIKGGRTTWSQFSQIYTEGLRKAHLHPGVLSAQGTTGGYHGLVKDGDALCCSCAVGADCHRQLAAPLLYEAGWEVWLDGQKWPLPQLGLFGGPP